MTAYLVPGEGYPAEVLVFSPSPCSPLKHPEQDDAQLPLVNTAFILDICFWFGLA